MLIKGLLLQTKGSRRDRIALISDMLLCAVEGTSKTDIMCKVGLSTAQLNRYVPTLVKSELLETFKQKKVTIYKTTTKGKSFIEAFDTLIKLLD